MTIWKPELAHLDGPRYRAIADAIENDLQHGRISPGFQLPTHRELADQLGVTVGTVTRGYAEAARRGLLRGETGRGTFVGGSPRKETYFEHQEDGPQDAVDMGMTLPLNHLDPDISKTFSQLALEQDLQSALRYFPSRGRFQDRELGAEWLQRQHHLVTSPDSILITAGGQHALTVILSAAFRSGDTLAVDTITYPMIKTLARRFNIKLQPIAMDAEGMRPEELESACHTHKIHGIYCMPTVHNPTTAVMSESRRRAIGAIAEREDLLIVEDDAYALLSESAFIPISALHPRHGFYIASLSKAVTSGLRFGYLVAPEAYVKRLELAVADTLWMASPLCARIARHWIQDGTALQTIQRKQVEARNRNLLARSLFQDFRMQSLDTGYFVWLELPEEWNATDFAKQASEKQVTVTPIEHYLVGRNRPSNDAVRRYPGTSPPGSLGHSIVIGRFCSLNQTSGISTGSPACQITAGLHTPMPREPFVFPQKSHRSSLRWHHHHITITQYHCWIVRNLERGSGLRQKTGLLPGNQPNRTNTLHDDLSFLPHPALAPLEPQEHRAAQSPLLPV